MQRMQMEKGVSNRMRTCSAEYSADCSPVSRLPVDDGAAPRQSNTETEQHLIDRFGRDLQYAAEWTPVLDIAIMFRTIAHVFKGTNAF